MKGEYEQKRLFFEVGLYVAVNYNILEARTCLLKEMFCLAKLSVGVTKLREQIPKVCFQPMCTMEYIG